MKKKVIILIALCCLFIQAAQSDTLSITDSKNRFEADVWSSLNDMSILKSDFAVLQSLLEIVDELNLNTRIWSKE